MIDYIVSFQWEIFILAEIISLICLLLFGVVRYVFNKQKLSLSFLFIFIALIVIEAVIAVTIFMETGEISTFQIVITIFVIYACTFGISDFKKLDRWMRWKIGQWRGTELLTEKDKFIMSKQKDPKYIARKYRYSSLIHLLIFVIAQAIFWYYGLGQIDKAIPYLQDLSWIGTERLEETPYASDVIYGLSMVWGLVFVIDFIYSWSYTIFPSTKQG
ncbi:hypothetical protein [Oceanobacillus manasiensis]|uniref:hypothetical protein n=1 Tax=Oceanobacillus manasiensis TaxID=586413 RepID=UPI000B22A69E